jgi:hypothetical protein
MKNFILINSTRIIKSSIKRYCPVDDTKIALYYTTSRSKIENEMFDMETKDEQLRMLEELDSLL